MHETKVKLQVTEGSTVVRVVAVVVVRGKGRRVTLGSALLNLFSSIHINLYESGLSHILTLELGELIRFDTKMLRATAVRLAESISTQPLNLREASAALLPPLPYAHYALWYVSLLLIVYA